MSQPSPHLPNADAPTPKLSALATVNAFLSRWANPVYHFRKIREDLIAALHGIKVWHLGKLKHDEAAFNTAARGKMFATFVMSGAFSTVALPIGAAAQAATSSAQVGFAATVGVGHGVALVAYHIIWLITNRDLYKGSANPFIEAEKDLLPLQWGMLKVGAIFTAIAFPLNWFIVEIIHRYLSSMERYLPMSVIMVIFDVLIFNAQFVRIIGNLFERSALVLARRHCI